MTLRASSLNREADKWRRLLSDLFTPECVAPDAPEADPHVVQAEQEMHVAALKGQPADDLFEEAWKRAKAEWLVYATEDPQAALRVRHLDVIAWIAAALHERAQTDATPFPDEDALFRYLWTAKQWQLGTRPSEATRTLLRMGAATVWAQGSVEFTPEARVA